MKFILTLSLLFLFALCSAQKGELVRGRLVSSAGDTLRGTFNQVNGAKMHLAVDFTQDGESIAKSYSPAEAKAILIEGQPSRTYISNINATYYVKNDPISKPLFLEELVAGPLGLYMFLDDQTSTIHFFLYKDQTFHSLPNKTKTVNKGGRDILIQDPNFKGIMNLLMSDCKQRLENVTYTIHSLIKSVVGYNKCKGYSYVTRNAFASTTHVGFTIGAAFQSFGYKTGSSSTSYTRYENGTIIGDDQGFYDYSDTKAYSVTSINPVFGISLELVPSFNRHISLSMQAQYSTRKTEDDKLEVKYSLLQVPFTVRYSFMLNSRLRPYLGAGVASNFSFNANVDDRNGIAVFNYLGQVPEGPDGQPLKVEVRENVKAMREWTPTFEAGLDFAKNGTRKFRIGARYDALNIYEIQNEGNARHRTVTLAFSFVKQLGAAK